MGLLLQLIGLLLGLAAGILGIVSIMHNNSHMSTISVILLIIALMLIKIGRKINNK